MQNCNEQSRSPFYVQLLAAKQQPYEITYDDSNSKHQGLNAQQRIENMQGAVLPGKHAGAVEGKSVLLIDDVLTTGSTAEACAKALREAGAKEIYLLTAARRDPHAHLSAPIED